MVFMWGLITSLNDILIPQLKNIFSLYYTRAMLVQFYFFGAYFSVSTPLAHWCIGLAIQRGLLP